MRDPQILVGTARGLLAVALLVGAARTLAPTVLPGCADRADRLLRASLLFVLIANGTVAALGLAGALSPSALLVATGLIWGLSRRGLRPPARPEPSGPPADPTIPWPWLLLGGLLSVDALVSLLLPPTNWDAMTYHLYFPARWLQEGGLVHVPTVFADPTAAFAPQNGALLFTWILALFGHDTLCNVVQVGAAALLGVAVSRLALQLGLAGNRWEAAFAGLVAALLPPVRQWAATANVDVLMTAAFLASLGWAAHLDAKRREGERARSGTLLAAAAGLGLVAGTKTLGAPLAFFGLFVLLLGQRHRIRSFVATPSGLPLVACGFLVGGGWWFVRNAIRHRNPVFPVELVWGPLHLPGPLTTAALEDSPFRIPLGDWLLGFPHYLGLPGLALVALGWFGSCRWLAGSLRPDPGRRPEPWRVALIAVGFPLAWAVFHATAVPYNNQFRFLLPALALATVGLPRAIAALPPKLRTPARIVLALGVAVAPPAVDGGPLRWLELLLGETPRATAAVVLACLVVAGLAAARLRAVEQRRALPIAALVLSLWVLVAQGAANARDVRPAVLRSEDYGVLSPAMLPFQNPELPPLEIAYSGFNLPYPLLGPDRRHRVRWIPTAKDPGVFDWLLDPRLHSGRGGRTLEAPRDDASAWTERLTREGIDVVVVHRILADPDAFPAGWPLDDGFPIERRWMRERPEAFEAILAWDRGEIYRFDPAGNRGVVPVAPALHRRTTPR